MLLRTINRHWPTGLALALLIGAVTYFHWPGIQPGYTFLPVDLANNLLPWRPGEKTALQNGLISDPLYQYYPFLSQRLENFRLRQTSLWTPLIYLGHPAHADPLFQSYYPFFWLCGLLWGAARGYGLALYGHALLAALTMFALLRTLRVSHAAACLGALTYSLSGYLVTWFEFAFWTSTLAWLPTVLWCYRLALLKKQSGYAALAGLALGLASLAGQLQFVSAFGLGLVLVTWVYVGQKSFVSRRPVVHPLLYLALIGVIALLLAGVQLLPFLELLAHSRRQLTQGLVEPLPFRQLATLFVPYFYGNPTQGVYWGAGNYNELTLYPGIVALYLAITALLARPRFWTLCLGGLGLLLLYWATGGPGVASLSAVPGLNYLPLHRLLFALTLIIGILAAQALDAKTSGWALLGSTLLVGGLIGLPFGLNWGEAATHWEMLRSELGTTLLLVGLAALLLMLKRLMPNGTVALNWLLVALLFGDLVNFGRNYNPRGPVDQLLPVTPALQVLQDRASGERVVGLQRANQWLLPPNLLMKFALAEPGGYSSLMTPRLHQLLAADDPQIEWRGRNRMSNFVLFSYPSARLLDLFNVRYIVSPAQLFDPGPEAESVQTECAATTAEITSNVPLHGQFTVRHTAINRLDLPFRLGGERATVRDVQLRMWRETTGDLIVEKLFTGAELRQQPDQTVYFAPEKDAPGQRYRWEVAALTDEPTGVALCASAAGSPVISLYGSELTEIYRDDQLYIYERLAPFPRAYVVYASQTVTAEQTIVDRLLAETFDARNLALSEVALALPAESHLTAQAAEIVAYHNTQVTVRATAQAPGLLVLADLDYPGWHATVDGAPAPIQRVNFILRGVRLEPGEHTVVFEFRPNSLVWGWVSTGLGVLLALLVSLWPVNRG